MENQIKKIKIVMLCDQFLIAEGICKILESEDSFCLLDNYQESNDLINSCLTMPDAVIINAPLSLENTFKAVDNIKNNFQKARIILLVPDLNEDLRQEAASYVVDALIEKNIDGSQLIELIKEVCTSSTWVPQVFSERR